jgi:GMP synthase-like glutamine amidotransferase
MDEHRSTYLGGEFTPERRAQYEWERELLAQYERERRQDVRDLLSDRGKILCINMQDSVKFAPRFADIHPDRQQAFYDLHGTGDTVADGMARQIVGRVNDPLVTVLDLYKRGAYEEGDELPRHFDEYAGLVITGGPAMVSALHDPVERDSNPGAAKSITRIIDFIQAWTKRKNPPPILGVCLGHQIIAAANGGKVTYLPHPDGREFDDDGKRFRELGPVKLHLTDEAKQDPLFRHFGEDYFTIQATHFQHVSDKPTSAIVLAHNAISPTQLLSYYDGVIHTVQNHPEISDTYMDIVLDFRQAENMDVRAFREQLFTGKTHEARVLLFVGFLRQVSDYLRKGKV